jgi:hypothetical protein
MNMTPTPVAGTPPRDLADILYTEYCIAVGGVAFNGDPLPDWQTFRSDPTKRKQSGAWLRVSQVAIEQLVPVNYSLVQAPSTNTTG